MIREMRNNLSIILIVVSVGLWATNNFTDAIFAGVMALCVREERGE